MAFLKAIIDLFSNPHDKSVEDVKAVFEKFGAYVCEEMPEGSDFDEALHFEDSVRGRVLLLCKGRDGTPHLPSLPERGLPEIVVTIL